MEKVYNCYECKGLDKSCNSYYNPARVGVCRWYDVVLADEKKLLESKNKGLRAFITFPYLEEIIK